MTENRRVYTNKQYSLSRATPEKFSVRYVFTAPDCAAVMQRRCLSSSRHLVHTHYSPSFSHIRQNAIQTIFLSFALTYLQTLLRAVSGNDSLFLSLSLLVSFSLFLSSSWGSWVLNVGCTRAANFSFSLYTWSNVFFYISLCLGFDDWRW